MLINTDIHIHTLRSGHAFNTVDECVSWAKKKKLNCIGISEHGPAMEGAPHLGYFEVLPRLPKYINGIKMLYGCEANVLDVQGTLDISEEVATYLDYVMVGLHERTSYGGNSIRENTDALIAAMQKKCVNIISHPYRSQFPIDVYDVVYCAKEKKVILEVNKIVFLNAIKMRDGLLIAELNKYITTIIETKAKCILGSDAHYAAEIGLSNEEWGMLNTHFDFSQLQFINNSILSYLKR